MSKLNQSFSNLELALDSLVNSLHPPPTEDRDFAGIIQNFEFTYELCWKTLKLILEQNGIAAQFPKACFQEAFKFDLIAGNEVWKEIQEARNLSVHTYDKKLAKKLYADIRDRYVKVFLESVEKMRKTVNQPIP